MINAHVESPVRSTPAVYISRSGPNPVMVELDPLTLQIRTLFGGTSSSSPSSIPAGSVDDSGIPRSVSIHVYTGKWNLRDAYHG